MESTNNRVQAFILVNRAIEKMLSEDGTPTESEAYLINALELDPDSLEALRESAHFYNSVTPDRSKAIGYANLCIRAANELIAEMEVILADSD
jgi:hypothetical protein